MKEKGGRKGASEATQDTEAQVPSNNGYGKESKQQRSQRTISQSALRIMGNNKVWLCEATTSGGIHYAAIKKQNTMASILQVKMVVASGS